MIFRLLLEKLIIFVFADDPEAFIIPSVSRPCSQFTGNKVFSHWASIRKNQLEQSKEKNWKKMQMSFKTMWQNVSK